MKSQPTSSLINTEQTLLERLSLAIPAAFVVALSTGLIASLIYLVLALSPLVEVRPELAYPAKVRARLATQMQYRHSAATATTTQSTIEKMLCEPDSGCFSVSAITGETHPVSSCGRHRCSGLEVTRKLSTVGPVL
jgi:hypothetical protein